MKHLYSFELKRSARPLLAWALCLAGLLVMGYLEYLFVFRDNADVAAIMSALPPPLAALLGISSHVDFSTARGFYCLMADFVFYVLAAYAALLGAGMISREESDRTADFLYSLPMSRSKLLLGKWLAGITCCGLLNLFMTIAAAFTFGAEPGLLPAVPASATTMFLMELVYFAAGALLAALCRRPGRASAACLILLGATLLGGKLSAMAGITSGPFLVLSTPDYFPARRWLYGGSFGLWPWLLSAAWIVLFFGGALCYYERKDL